MKCMMVEVIDVLDSMGLRYIVSHFVKNHYLQSDQIIIKLYFITMLWSYIVFCQVVSYDWHDTIVSIIEKHMIEFHYKHIIL